jgi:hypothetical protein
MSIKVLISHSHDEKPLAGAWKELLENVSLSGIQVWFSSDSSHVGGMPIGREWRDQLYDRLADSEFILAIQTPSSIARPWIMWECGVASGIEKERGLIPIIFSMGRGDLASPLASYQVYQGEDKEQVKEVCQRLVTKAGLTFNEIVFNLAFDNYLNAISLHRPRKPIPIEQMHLWRTRFQELISSGRSHEVFAKREAMYASFGDSFSPIEPSLHELLSKIMFDNRHYDLLSC